MHRNTHSHGQITSSAHRKHGLSANYPPCRWKPPCKLLAYNKLPKIVDLKTFKVVHWNNQYRILNYVERPRSNYFRPNPELLSELRPEAEEDMFAANALSRINFAELVLDEVRRHPAGPKGEFFFITITPRRYVLPLDAAWTINRNALIAFSRQALEGINFVGMIDLALYKRWGRGRPSVRDHVAYHSHMVGWGASRQQINRALARTREKEESIIPGHPVADVRSRSPHQLETSLSYMLKAPQKEYNVSRPSLEEKVDHETGEVIKLGYRQQKRPLRTGDRVRLCEVLQEVRLPHLFFGNKEGTEIVRKVRTELGVNIPLR